MTTFLDDYFRSDADGVRVSPEQGSRFAKEIAGDFNPIHDADSSRFCVPGDLLFALVLRFYGISRWMRLRFEAMVGAEDQLLFPEAPEDAITVATGSGGTAVAVARAGEICHDPQLVEALIRRYAGFSGRNFPEFLLPLMRHHGVMFNPDRPLVIYDGMEFEFDLLDPAGLDVILDDAALEVKGRRAEERLSFRMVRGDEQIGSGTKSVVLAGLKPYDAERMEAFVEDYVTRRQRYEEAMAGR